jgi:hypothetical protein
MLKKDLNSDTPLFSFTAPAAGKKPVAEYFYQLAEKYYAGEESVRPDSRYESANVWYWQEGLGLTYKEVPSAIFLDIYAMRSARQALEADSNYAPAVSLWLAADLRKESRLTSESADPTLVPGQQSADAYSRAAGATATEDYGRRRYAGATTYRKKDSGFGSQDSGAGQPRCHTVALLRRGQG